VTGVIPLYVHMADRFKPLHPYVAYSMNLHMPNVISKLQYRFRNSSVVYGIRCRPTGMIYVGSISQPGLRFHNHLVSGDPSNPQLQEAIRTHGIDKFTVSIFNIVSYPSDFNIKQRNTLLRQSKQEVLNRFPKKSSI
jgi:hypothetical protein